MKSPESVVTYKLKSVVAENSFSFDGGLSDSLPRSHVPLFNLTVTHMRKVVKPNP